MNKYLKNGIRVGLTIVFFLCLATSALANGVTTMFPPTYPAKVKPYFDGFYLGVGAGVVGSKADTEDSFGVGEEENGKKTYFFYIGPREYDLGEYGFNANIFAGYGKTVNSSYYLGGELFGNYFNTPKMKNSYVAFAYEDKISSGKMDIENPYSFGGDIRVGYLISPKIMIYVLFGLDYAEFKVKNEVTWSFDDSASGTVTDDFHKWSLGYMPGVGIETGLSDHVSLRAQYTYTFYPSFSHEAITYPPPLHNGKPFLDVKTKVTPGRGLFTVMLSYLFNT